MGLSSFLTRVSNAFTQASQLFTSAKGGQQGTPPFNPAVNSDQARGNYDALMLRAEQFNEVMAHNFQQQGPMPPPDAQPSVQGRTQRGNPVLRTVPGVQGRAGRADRSSRGAQATPRQRGAQGETPQRAQQARQANPPRYTADDLKRLYGKDAYTKLDDWVKIIASGEGSFGTGVGVGARAGLSVGIFQWT